MPQIIWIRGTSNSGKTSSIRKFLENRGIFFPENPKDISVVLPIQKNGKTYKIGVASAGDTAQLVMRNFTFLNPHNCDFIVCASKASGRTVVGVQNQATQLGANWVEVRTQKLRGAAATVMAINMAAGGIANQIEQNIH